MKYRNAKYISENGWIDCEIEHPQFGWIPYTLDPADTDMTINNDELFAAMSKNGDVAAYVPPTQAELDAKAAQAVRDERDMRLAIDVDTIAGNALRWDELSDSQKKSVSAYRRALLDISGQDGFPHKVIWPEKPL